VRRLRLLGQQHRKPGARRDAADARAGRERFGGLLAAVQHHDERHVARRRRRGGQVQRIGEMVDEAAGGGRAEWNERSHAPCVSRGDVRPRARRGGRRAPSWWRRCA
jgi:hypothetical protein